MPQKHPLRPTPTIVTAPRWSGSAVIRWRASLGRDRGAPMSITWNSSSPANWSGNSLRVCVRGSSRILSTERGPSTAASAKTSPPGGTRDSLFQATRPRRGQGTPSAPHRPGTENTGALCGSTTGWSCLTTTCAMKERLTISSS